MSIHVVAQSKTQVCDPSLTGIAGSNTAGCRYVCLLRVLYVVRKRLHSSREILPSVVCLSMCVCVCVCVCVVSKPQQQSGLGPNRAIGAKMKKIILLFMCLEARFITTFTEGVHYNTCYLHVFRLSAKFQC